MIVTVTLNAAMDRTLSVPNFQLGHRHRASSGMASAGGKGINVARALKRLGVPVVCTGLAGGRNGTLIVEDLTNEGILNDFVRIQAESRTSVAVLDPISNAYTEINEWGPEVGEGELEILAGKLEYLSQSADLIVLAGSLPRGVATSFYADTIRDLSRSGVPVVLDGEGEPLRLAVEAEPDLVAPNREEAEALVGHEFGDDRELADGLDEIAELGAKNVLLTTEEGCFALVREDREEMRLHARAPRLEPVSTVGAGDVLLAGFLAARAAGRPVDEALRSAVAAGSASVLEAGAGRFDPKEVGRLASHVEVERLARVTQDA
jgi:1-phosphofructokinase family hexose kinase